MNKKFFFAYLLCIGFMGKAQELSPLTSDQEFSKKDIVLYAGVGPRELYQYTNHVAKVLSNTSYLLNPVPTSGVSWEAIALWRKHFVTQFNFNYVSAQEDSTDKNIVGFTQQGLSLTQSFSFKKHKSSTLFNALPQIGIYANYDRILGYKTTSLQNVVLQTKTIDTWKSFNTGYLYGINLMKSFNAKSMLCLMKFHLEIGQMQKFNNNYFYRHNLQNIELRYAEKLKPINYFKFTFHCRLPVYIYNIEESSKKLMI